MTFAGRAVGAPTLRANLVNPPGVSFEEGAMTDPDAYLRAEQARAAKIGQRICSCGDWFTPLDDESLCWVCLCEQWEDEDE